MSDMKYKTRVKILSGFFEWYEWIVVQEDTNISYMWIGTSYLVELDDTRTWVSEKNIEIIS